MNAPAPTNPLFDYGAFRRPEELLAESVLETESFVEFSDELDAELRRLEEAFADWTTRSALKSRRR